MSRESIQDWLFGTNQEQRTDQLDLNRENRSFVERELLQSRQDMMELFGMAQGTVRDATNRAGGVITEMYPQLAGISQDANVHAQQANVDGLQQYQNALMGVPLDYSTYKPYKANYNTDYLGGLFESSDTQNPTRSIVEMGQPPAPAAPMFDTTRPPTPEEEEYGRWLYSQEVNGQSSDNYGGYGGSSYGGGGGGGGYGGGRDGFDWRTPPINPTSGAPDYGYVDNWARGPSASWDNFYNGSGNYPRGRSEEMVDWYMGEDDTRNQ